VWFLGQLAGECVDDVSGEFKVVVADGCSGCQR
jgi:hypothetical protein